MCVHKLLLAPSARPVFTALLIIGFVNVRMHCFITSFFGYYYNKECVQASGNAAFRIGPSQDDVVPCTKDVPSGTVAAATAYYVLAAAAAVSLPLVAGLSITRSHISPAALFYPLSICPYRFSRWSSGSLTEATSYGSRSQGWWATVVAKALTEVLPVVREATRHLRRRQLHRWIMKLAELTNC